VVFIETLAEDINTFVWEGETKKLGILVKHIAFDVGEAYFIQGVELFRGSRLKTLVAS
jgi:hypothetical protein